MGKQFKKTKILQSRNCGTALTVGDTAHGPVIMARVVHHIKRKEANTRQAIQDRHRDYASFMELVRNARAPNDCTCTCPSLHYVRSAALASMRCRPGRATDAN